MISSSFASSARKYYGKYRQAFFARVERLQTKRGLAKQQQPHVFPEGVLKTNY